MGALNQVRVAWTGFSGGPGVSTFYFVAPAAPPLAALKTFFDGWKAFIKDSVTLTFPSSGLQYESSTGAAVGTWAAAAPAATACTGAAGYAALAGGITNWLTGSYLAGRQVRGKTFMVPLVSSSYDADGTFLPGFLTPTRAAATAFVAAAPDFRIWSRKNLAAVAVTSANVPDKVMYLTSRRA